MKFLLVLFASSLSHAATVIDMKVDKTSLRVNCQAVREYAQIHGATPGSVADQINAQIRRELTVGKKLREEDCPEATSSENFEYHNWARATSQRASKLGVNYLVAFPGGSGRTVRWCDTYDLKNGHEINLRRCLKPEAIALLKTRACALSKKEKLHVPPDEPNYFCSDKITAMTFCWDDAGIRAFIPWSGDWKAPDWVEPVLSESELKKLIVADCGL